MSRVFNFSAGPAAIPDEVLIQAQTELLDFRGTGMSVMEMSHRGKVFMEVAAEVENSRNKEAPLRRAALSPQPSITGCQPSVK